MGRWYVARGKVKEGPFSQAELEAAVASGHLQATDMVLQEGMRRWIAARDVPDLVFSQATQAVFAIPVVIREPLSTTAAATPAPAMPQTRVPASFAAIIATGLRLSWFQVAAGGVGLCMLIVLAALIFGGKSNSPMCNQPLAQNSVPSAGGDSPLLKDSTSPVTKPDLTKKAAQGQRRTAPSISPAVVAAPVEPKQPSTFTLQAPKLQGRDDSVSQSEKPVSPKNQPTLAPQLGHSKPVWSVALSRDGKQVLTGSLDNTARLWDVASGMEIRAFDAGTHRLGCVAFSHDGNQMLTGGSDIRGNPTGRLWNASTGKLVRTLGLSGTSAAFSADGKLLLTASGSFARLLDVASGMEIRNFKGGWAVALSPDDKQVLTAGGDKTAALWDAASGKEIRTFHGHSDSVLCVGFSPDGKQALTGSRDKTARLWDTASGAEIRTFKGHFSAIESVAFSPDGKQALTASDDKTARLWDAASGREIRALHGHSSYVRGATFSPDGGRVLTWSNDGTARWWDLAGGKEKILAFNRGLVDIVESVAFSPDGTQVLTTGGASAQLWGVAGGKMMRAFQGHSGSVTSASFTPDGKWVLTGSADQTARLWDAEAGNELRIFKGHTSAIRSVACSPDGKQVVTGSEDKTVRLWDAASGKEIRTFRGRSPFITDPGYVAQIRAVAFSPNRAWLLAGCGFPGSRHNRALLWDADSGAEIRAFHGGPASVISSVSISPDGDRVLTGSWDNTARLWDANSGRLIHTFEMPPGVFSVAFSPDGKQVVAGSGDRTARLWDANSGKQIQAFLGHTSRVSTVAFSPEGKRVLTGSMDATARLWEASSGRELCRLLSFQDGTWAVFTPENYYMASRGALRGVGFSIGKRVFPFDQFDLKFNRPDKVIESIGLSSPGMIAAYRHVYQKRLKRMKFSEDMLSDDLHVPTVAINSDVTFTTQEKTTKLKVNANDSKYLLDRLQVYVNGVPVGDSGGSDLRKQQTKSWQQDIDIELSSGKNRIDVSVLNEKGAESLKETVTIDCESPAGKRDLYVVVVGVSDYQDSRYRLTYADKDARDLADLFEGKQQRFGQLKVLRLLNRDATREKILKAREFLKPSQVDDQVVLFFAGHGLLDNKLDYYFATADIDFKKPAERGMPYESVEGLLDGIKARRRLVLMDTCHSGELDKEEAKLVQSEKLPQGQVKTRSFRGLQLEAPRLGLGNSYRLLEEMFADLRRGTGAVVIASAGGAEFALESETWKNGVFTYAVLRGLKGEADRDKDGKVRISELRDFVQGEVRRLTHGRQVPTARRDNLEIDFTVE